MAIQNRAPRQPVVDHAVAAAMEPEEDGRRAKAVEMTPGARKKAEKGRKRNRKMIDLPEGLEELVDRTAEELGVPVSQVAVYLMIQGAGQATMSEMKEVRRFSRSMRYEYVLEMPRVPRKIAE